jgi:hypothetical protein
VTFRGRRNEQVSVLGVPDHLLTLELKALKERFQPGSSFGGEIESNIRATGRTIAKRGRRPLYDDIVGFRKPWQGHISVQGENRWEHDMPQLPESECVENNEIQDEGFNRV